MSRAKKPVYIDPDYGIKFYSRPDRGYITMVVPPNVGSPEKPLNDIFLIQHNPKDYKFYDTIWRTDGDPTDKDFQKLVDEYLKNTKKFKIDKIPIVEDYFFKTRKGVAKSVKKSRKRVGKRVSKSVKKSSKRGAKRVAKSVKKSRKRVAKSVKKSRKRKSHPQAC